MPDQELAFSRNATAFPNCFLFSSEGSEQIDGIRGLLESFEILELSTPYIYF